MGPHPPTVHVAVDPEKFSGFAVGEVSVKTLEPTGLH